MKSVLTTLLLATATHVSLGQSRPASSEAAPAAQAEKCFPSGTSLVDGWISSDAKYVAVVTVDKLVKHFDTRTLQVVAAAKEYSDEALANRTKYNPEPTGVVNFTLETTLLPKNEDDEVFGSFAIKNTRGETVAAYEKRFMGDAFFEPQTGTLITHQYRKTKPYKITLYRIGESPKTLINEYYLLGSPVVVSPNGRYMVTGRGVVFDLVSGKLVEFTESHSAREETVYLGFRKSSDEFFTASDKGGIVTYSCATGKPLRSIPIPAELPRIDGFKVVPAPNGEDFMYFMKFRNNQAAGLAYWVHDGKGASFCDPLWEKQQADNYLKLFKEVVDRLEQERVAEAAYAREKAQREARYEQERLAREAEDRKAGRVASGSRPADTAAPAPKKVSCSKCFGTGAITQTDTFGGDIVTEELDKNFNWRKVIKKSTGRSYTNKVRCPACNGSGYQ